MTNKENNKLDNKIKETLKDYEAPYNPEHWAEMETLLGAKPVVNPFRKFGFSLNTFIGVAAIGAASVGAYYLFSGTGHKDAAANEQKNLPAVVLPADESKSNSPSASFALENNNAASTAPENQNLNNLPIPAAFYPNGNPNSVTQNPVNNGLVRGKQASHNYSKEAQALTGKTDVDFLIQNYLQQNDTLYHAEVPVFSDMIDPKKGFVNPTQEKADMKKVAQKEYNIAGNSFVVYPDEGEKTEKSVSDSEVVMNSDSKSEKLSDSKLPRPKKERRRKNQKADEPTVSADNGNTEIKEIKNDSTKKRNDKPKYNEKKDPSDPYDN